MQWFLERLKTIKNDIERMRHQNSIHCKGFLEILEIMTNASWMEKGNFFVKDEMFNMPRMWDKERSELQKGFKRMTWVWPPRCQSGAQTTELYWESGALGHLLGSNMQLSSCILLGSAILKKSFGCWRHSKKICLALHYLLWHVNSRDTHLPSLPPTIFAPVWGVWLPAD